MVSVQFEYGTNGNNLINKCEGDCSTLHQVKLNQMKRRHFNFICIPLRTIFHKFAIFV